jgi:capsular polysaccharide transport system permease protein
MNINTIDHQLLREVATKAYRENSRIKRHRWMILFVGLPTALAIAYYGFIASPVYVSQSSFVIKSASQKTIPNTLSVANLLQTSGLSAGEEQTKEVLQYVRSRNALKDLLRETDVRAKYSSRGADFLSRFPQPLHDGSFENFFHYYSSMVGADTDPDSGLAVLEVHAFTPEDAYDLNSRLLNLSERLVNRLNERAESRGIAEAEQRVAQAEERVRNARLALSAYRNQQELIDPTKQAAGVLDISNKLVSEEAALQAQLDLMLRVTPRNPTIPAVRNRIAAIKREIGAQNGKVVGTPTGIASKLGSYEKLQIEQDFATQMLTAANASLESARTDAEKQQFYLERVVEPNKPDESTLPHRLKRILIVFGASVCLYLIGWMLVVGILEHAPED